MFWHRTKHKIRRRQSALQFIAGAPPGRILDAPCGEGTLARDLAGLGHQVWALDWDPDVFAATDGIRFDVADLNLGLPYPDGFFDVVISLEGIEHLETPAVCIREFSRVLRPGGVLILSTPNINNVQSRLEYFISGRFSGFKTVTRLATERQVAPVHWHITVPYLPTIAFLLTRHGLEINAVDVTMVKTKQWLLLPVALPMWLMGRHAPAASVASLLGSWKLLLGRSVVLRALKPPAATGAAA